MGSEARVAAIKKALGKLNKAIFERIAKGDETPLGPPSSKKEEPPPAKKKTPPGEEYGEPPDTAFSTRSRKKSEGD